MAQSKKIIIGPHRCIFPQLTEPKAFKGQTEDQAKFKITLLIPKSDKEGANKLLNFIKDAIDECESWSPIIKKQVFATARKTVTEEGLNNNCILRDGDEINTQLVAEDKKPYEAYAGNYVVSINRPMKWGAPLVVGRVSTTGKKAPDEILPSQVSSIIRPGYQVKVEISTFCFTKPKNGITLQMQGVQFWKKDEEFGKQNNFDADDDFDDDDDDTFGDKDDFDDDEVMETPKSKKSKK